MSMWIGILLFDSIIVETTASIRYHVRLLIRSVLCVKVFVTFSFTPIHVIFPMLYVVYASRAKHRALKDLEGKSNRNHISQNWDIFMQSVFNMQSIS